MITSCIYSKQVSELSSLDCICVPVKLYVCCIVNHIYLPTTLMSNYIVCLDSLDSILPCCQNESNLSVTQCREIMQALIIDPVAEEQL